MTPHPTPERIDVEQAINKARLCREGMPHYCPNCDRSFDSILAPILAALAAQTHAPEGIDQKEQGADPWIGPLQQRRREIMAIPHGMACGGTCSTCEELRRIDVALKTIADYQPLDGESAALLIEREKTTDQPKGSDEHEVGRR